MKERGKRKHFFIIAIFSENTEVRFCAIFLHKWRKKSLNNLEYMHK